MANQTITQLPDAGPITGTELVPIVQNGGTYKTTTAAISASPSQTQTFLTKNQELTLPNSRYLSTETGLGLTDGGATSFYRISLNGASGSLEAAGAGIVVKNSSTTVVARTLATSGAGLSVSNGDGTGGNPTFQLTGIAAAIANMGGTGMLAVVGGASIAGRQIVGTTNQINVANGNGSGDPTISIANNVVLPGTAAMTIPSGSIAQQPVGAPGQLRFNTTTNTFDGYDGSGWSTFALGSGVSSFSAGSTGLTPAAMTTGAVVLGGVLNVASGGTGANSLTGYVKGSGTTALTSSPTVPTTDLSGTVSNAQLANSSLTVNGTTIALGGSGTITAATPNALTINAGLSGTSYNGSAPVTIGIIDTGVTAGSYGGANKALTATVNTRGQLTSLAETNIAITNAQVSGLGTMSTQDANNVAVTGGSINGATIGASTAAAGTFTSVTTSTGTISTAPVNPTDIVNKTYVDTIAASGITYHTPVKYEAPNPYTVTYNNGASGVGATLTNAGALTAFAPDGPTASIGDRVLIYVQANAIENGVYTVTTVGSGSVAWVLTRATDADSYGLKNPNALGEGDAFFVTSGSTGAGETYVCNTSGAIVFGTTPITFTQISSAQIYSAGTGLTLSGTQFSISNTAVTAGSYGTASSTPTLAINAQGQVTSASNTAIAINANQITSGTVTNAQLQNSAITVNGTSISLGGSGTVTAANPFALTIGTGLTGTSYNGSSAVTVALGASGVSAATYGSASQVPVFAVDTYGRVTSVTNTPIAISSGAVSGLAASATTDTTNASNITSGTLPTGRLSGSYTGITAVGTLTAGTWNASAISVAYGGTGLTATPTNGQVPIGNGTGFSLSTLTAGSNVVITNTAGGIQISATAAFGGTVTSVDVSGGTTGLSFSGGPITTSGTITMAGTLGVANGGTGANTLTGYVYGNGTGTMTASTTIPNTAITGLGTMSTQNSNSVAITGGSINGTTVGATTATTVRGTTITATTQFSGPGTGLTGTATSLSIGGNAATATSATTATQVANALTAGTYLTSAGTFTGAAARTFAVDATSANTASKVVARDASGNFSAGTITASLNGNAATATSIAGGAANQILVQSGASTTSFIVAPTVANTYLEWSGTTYQWSNNPLGTVTSVSGTGTVSGITLSGTVTSSGDLTLGGTLSVTPSDFSSQTANTFLAAPNGTAGTPTFRAIVAADVPTLNQNTTGSAATLTTSRTLWGQSFNGSANVTGALSSVTTIGMSGQLTNTLAVGTAPMVITSTTRVANLNVATAGTADTLTTARTINGVSFNGSANITVTANTTNALTLGAYLTGTSFNGSAAVTAAVDATTTNTASKVVARDASGDFAAGTITATLSGNATTATTATNATNVATTATATNADFFVPFVAASTTGNQALGVDAGITYNPSTNALTASINGGTF